MFPDLPENEVVFTVGGKGVRFDGYDEEMVVIWEDVRADQLRREYSVEGVLNLMELYPKKRAYNVKFGKVTLTHQVNIFTTPNDEYEDFFKGLLIDPRNKKEPAKEEDIEQIKRRFPIVINLSNTEIDILRNEKIFGDDKNQPSKFVLYRRIWNINIAELNSISVEEAKQAVFDKITAPIVKLYEMFKANSSDEGKASKKDDAPLDDIVISEELPVEEELNEKLKEQYLCFCKDLLNYYRLPNGEFGPYNVYHNIAWVLGDRLTDDYASARCPMGMDQWKRYGYPTNYDPEAYSSYSRKETEIEIRKYENVVTSDDEEYEDYDVNKYKEIFSSYVQDLSEATELFIADVSYPALITWAETVSGSVLFPIDTDEMDPEDIENWMACWEKAKSACVSSGLISSEQEWYSTFQKALHKIEVKKQNSEN